LLKTSVFDEISAGRAPPRLALQPSRTHETPPPGRQKRADIAKNGSATQRRIAKISWLCCAFSQVLFDNALRLAPTVNGNGARMTVMAD